MRALRSSPLADTRYPTHGPKLDGCLILFRRGRTRESPHLWFCPVFYEASEPPRLATPLTKSATSKPGVPVCGCLFSCLTMVGAAPQTRIGPQVTPRLPQMGHKWTYNTATLKPLMVFYRCMGVPTCRCCRRHLVSDLTDTCEISRKASSRQAMVHEQGVFRLTNRFEKLK